MIITSSTIGSERPAGRPALACRRAGQTNLRTFVNIRGMLYHAGQNGFAVVVEISMRRYDIYPVSYQVDPNRTDLAAEFRQNIRGPHSEELRKVLHRMRGMPISGKYVLIVREPFRKWRIGRLSGRRGDPVEDIDHAEFDSLDEAEWQIFRLRWQALTGLALELDNE